MIGLGASLKTLGLALGGCDRPVHCLRAHRFSLLPLSRFSGSERGVRLYGGAP